MNILVGKGYRAKIADFGLSKLKESNSLASVVGTPLWMAPEIMKSEHYSEKADVYRHAP